MLPSSRARLATALAAVVALAAGALAVQQMLPAAAAPSVSAVAPTAAPAANLVQGVVVDQAGRPVDGVEVGAFDAQGDRVASDETYASTWPDGEQHGYFFVEVPRGTHTIKLMKTGYRTVEYDAGQITKRRKKISMGEIEIQKIAAPTTTTATPGRSTITTKEAGSVSVTVNGEGKVTGEVEVREGRKVVGTAIIGRKATVTLTLDRLPKGDHVLAAYFLGTVDHKASSSKHFTLHVTKPRR